MRSIFFLCLTIVIPLPLNSVFAATIDLSSATIVVRSGDRPAAEKVAPTILSEEIARRTGVNWPVVEQWPADSKAIIALSVKSSPPVWRDRIPELALAGAGLDKPEGFTIHVQDRTASQPATVFITGADPRGLMFGVGKLLRACEWNDGSVKISDAANQSTSPSVPLRGHQLGYRARANSWDAWNVAQFDQHIRELVVFGANAIENIPFEDSQKSVLMPVPRHEMNVAMGNICAKYDLEYWVWVPVEFQLPDAKKETEFLDQQEAFYRDCKHLTGVFIPGGDPGSNEARDLLPFAKKMADLLLRYHPKAKIWISLQKFGPEGVDEFYRYLEEHRPAWFGGIVMGPSSPALAPTRARLSKEYKLRWYPDITHTVRCQYPVPWLDPAWGLTLGREGVNPRPVDYTAIYREGYRYTDGFLTYSDGIHDDFNKNLWSQLGWDPDRAPLEIARDYARFFFRGDLADEGADGLFAFETDYRGNLAENSSVDGTLLLWQKLEEKIPAAKRDWRFDIHLMRAYYDAYTRHRLLYEMDLQKQAMARLQAAPKIGPQAAIKDAREILNRAVTQLTHKDWFDKIDAFAESLFKRVGYQTRMEKYHASGTERGVVMDFIGYPLNDRWWLEHQFDRIEKLADAPSQLNRIAEICLLDNPPAGSFYDDLGHVGRSPRVPRLIYAGDFAKLPVDAQFAFPGQRWMDVQRRPIRYGWHTTLARPGTLTYTALDPDARYSVILFAAGISPLVIDGNPAKLIREGEKADEVQEQEFEVPREAVADGKLELTWKRPEGRTPGGRQGLGSAVELWVIKHPH